LLGLLLLLLLLLLLPLPFLRLNSAPLQQIHLPLVWSQPTAPLSLSVSLERRKGLENKTGGNGRGSR
jgi:hypothetical protein